MFGKPVFVDLRGFVRHDGVVAVADFLEVIHDADAEALRVSGERVRQIEAAALRKMRKALESTEADAAALACAREALAA